MDLSFFPFPPSLVFSFSKRGGWDNEEGRGDKEKRKGGEQAGRPQCRLPASDRVDGPFLISSYIKRRMCASIVQGYWVTPREQSIPQIPLTTHDQVMQAAEHNALRLFDLSWISRLAATGRLYFTHPVSLSRTTPRLLQLRPRPEFRISHWTGQLSKCKHWLYKMTFKKNLPETASMSGRAIILRAVQCAQDFLVEASPTFFYFLPVAADRQCTKGALSLRCQIFQVPALSVYLSLVSFAWPSPFALLFRLYAWPSTCHYILFLSTL